MAHKVRVERRIPRASWEAGRWTGRIPMMVALGALALSLAAFAAYRPAPQCPSYHAGGSGLVGFSWGFSRNNWTVTVVAVPRAYPDDTSYIEIRKDTGQVLLGRTPFSSLTEDRWSVNHVTYEDIHPAIPLVCEGDRLKVDAGTYPGGSFLVMFREGTVAGWTELFGPP